MVGWYDFGDGGMDGMVLYQSKQYNFSIDSLFLDRMLKAIFPFAFSLTPQETLVRTLGQLQLNTKEPLPQDYYNLIFSDPDALSSTFSAVIAQLPNASTAAAIIKTFTIILQMLRNNHYSIEILAVLESLEMPCLGRVEQGDRSWITEITIAVKSYLIRLPSIVDVFERMAAYKQSKSERSHSLNLSDLYRILNVFGLLFPAVTNCLNIIGRYYAKSYLYFPQFYKTIKQEILQGYEFMQHLVSSFKSSYRQYDSCELECFMQTVSAIELYCDRVEEFTMNKYFKGKGPNKKIYFREQQLDEISYYLLQLKNAKEECNHTGDQDQDFGAFQQ